MKHHIENTAQYTEDEQNSVAGDSVSKSIHQQSALRFAVDRASLTFAQRPQYQMSQ